MTRDEITAMARNCGWAKVGREMEYPVLTARLERFAALVAAAEREACEQICERRKSLYWMEFDKTGSDADRAAAIASEECADAIRARGDK